jgi:hypothetical protein
MQQAFIRLNRKTLWLGAALTLVASNAFADATVIGQIQMLQPYSPQGLVYVELQGAPQLDGGGCPNTFFVGEMSDANFKSFIYPTLLAANAAGGTIKLIVNGCSGAYPIVIGLEYSPRQ